MEAGTWEDIKKIGPSKIDHLKQYESSLIPILANVTIIKSVIENKIISGPHEWDLDKDHTKLLSIIEQVAEVLKVAPENPADIDWQSVEA